MDVPTIRDECDIAAVGMIAGTLDDIASLRKNPATGTRQLEDVQCLKYADEQTVLGMAAMLRALEAFPAQASFAEWGVVAAPRWPGRIGTAAAIDKYHAQGNKGVSAMLIPNVCLHAMSGTVSLALAMHGPNFGVGGGLANVVDGLLAGLIVQLEQRPPGTWVLLSEWDVEPLGFSDGVTPRATALALALVPAGSVAGAPKLRLQPTGASASGDPRLSGLTEHFSAGPGSAGWSCVLDWGLELVLTSGRYAA